MPTLLDEQIINIEFADLHKRVPLFYPGGKPPARYPGLHVSDILAHVAEKVGWLKPGDRLEEDMPWCMALGVAVEELLFSINPDWVWQPGEVVKDGIAGNCDGMRVLEQFEQVALVETKCTSKKDKPGDEFIAEEPMWMHQGKSYLELSDGLTVCQWNVLYYRGDYRGSGPICHQYTVQFERREISATWRMLKKWRVEVEERRRVEEQAREQAKVAAEFRQVLDDDIPF